MIISKILHRIKIQKDLQKYDKKLLLLLEKHPNTIIKLLFDERKMIYKHCDIILNKNIFITEKQINEMNIETLNHVKKIKNIINDVSD